MPGGKLTPKQERFCQEYIVDLNATQAAIRAGYSEKTANVCGPQNLVKPSIAARLKELQQEVQKRTEITADMVVKELALLAFGRITDLTRTNADGHLVLDFTDATPEQKAIVVGVKTKSRREKDGEDWLTVVETEVKTPDKVRALEVLGKHLGIFADKPEVNVIVNNDLSGLTDTERAARTAALLDTARARRTGSASTESS